MSYTNLTTPEHQAEIAKLITDLDKSIQAERERNNVHEVVKKTYLNSSAEIRQKRLHEQVQETTANLVILRSMGITVADLAKIITTA